MSIQFVILQVVKMTYNTMIISSAYEMKYMKSRYIPCYDTLGTMATLLQAA